MNHPLPIVESSANAPLVDTGARRRVSVVTVVGAAPTLRAVAWTYFRAPLGWRDIVWRTAKAIGDDHCLGLAAQLAFYFLLALFPALLFLVALVGYPPERLCRQALDNMLARHRAGCGCCSTRRTAIWT
jgi:hypothetical protein